MGYLTISALFSQQIRHLPTWPQAVELAPTSPALAGALVAQALPQAGSCIINLGALLATWWHTAQRIVWVASPETAATVRDVGMAFLPEEPPPAWGGQALIVESRERERVALVEDVFACGIYVAPHHETQAPWYWVCCLTVDGGADVFGLPCSQRQLNARLAQRGELLGSLLRIADPRTIAELGELGIGGLRSHTPEEQLRALRILRWLFAFSYFVDRPAQEDHPPPWTTAPAGTGPLPPVPPGPRGAGTRHRPPRVPLWSYRSLRFLGDDEAPPPAGQGGEGEGEGRPLDTTQLERAATIVSPYWRRVGEGERQRTIFVGAYAAHRWRRPEVLGQKVRV